MNENVFLNKLEMEKFVEICKKKKKKKKKIKKKKKKKKKKINK